MDPLSESVIENINKSQRNENKSQPSYKDSAGWPLDGEDPRGQMRRVQGGAGV